MTSSRPSPGYDSIYLHTSAAVDGAEPFWRGMAKEIHDGRTDPRYSPAVHFEIPIPPAPATSPAR